MDGWPTRPRTGSPRISRSSFSKRPHDDGDRLRRKPGAAGDIRLREAAVTPHQRHDQPLVIGAHACLVRAAAGIQNVRHRSGAVPASACDVMPLSPPVAPSAFRSGWFPSRPHVDPRFILIFARSRCTREKRHAHFLRRECHRILIIQFDLFIDSDLVLMFVLCPEASTGGSGECCGGRGLTCR